MPKFLIIQTAYLGDVVLATSVVEKLHEYFPDAQIDFLLRKGNERLLSNNPYINKLWIWDKKKGKYKNLLQMAVNIRNTKYTHVINLHRFITSGFITFFSGAGSKRGFDKNPFSFCYTKKVKHIISPPYTVKPVLEIERYQALIDDITDKKAALPKMYPSVSDYEKIKQYQAGKYICIAPSSVWYTKRYPVEKWVSLINVLPPDHTIYILGGPDDGHIASDIISRSENKNVVSLCGKLEFLQSAGLMQSAEMNYANDSGPLHFASATNAPMTGVFCSTERGYGFGPLSDNSRIVEVAERLYCKPCGIHGHQKCPEGHFRCAWEIKDEQLLWWISKKI